MHTFSKGRHAKHLVLLVGVLTLSLMAHAALAHSYKHGSLMIGHPWAQPTNGREGSAFFAALNTGEERDQLIEARTPIAGRVEFWVPPGSSEATQRGLLVRAIDYLRSLWHGGEAGVVSADTMWFPPEQPVPMRPGARHLRLLDLTRSLVEGDRFDLTLVFERNGPVTVEVWVERAPGS